MQATNGGIHVIYIRAILFKIFALILLLLLLICQMSLDRQLELRKQSRLCLQLGKSCVGQQSLRTLSKYKQNNNNPLFYHVTYIVSITYLSYILSIIICKSNRLNLTFWDTWATMWDPYTSKRQKIDHLVVILQLGKVKYWDGKFVVLFHYY